MRELQAIQNDINMMDQAIQNAGVGVDVSSWQSEKDKYEREFVDATAYWAGQERIKEEIQTNGYITDGLKNDEYTFAELSHTTADYILQAGMVQKWAHDRQEAFDKALSELQADFDHVTEELKKQNESKDELSRQLYQAMLDKADAEQKRDNISKLYTEVQEQLKNQEVGAITTIASLTAEEQDAQWQAQNTKQNNRIKATSIRSADPFDFANKMSIVTLALTGEEVEIETLYIKRYVIISETEVEQLRADYASKKAEIEAQNTVIPVMEPQPEPIKELDAEPGPIHEEVQAATSEGTTTGAGHTTENEMVQQPQESEVITLESLKAEVNAIKVHLGLVA